MQVLSASKVFSFAKNPRVFKSNNNNNNLPVLKLRWRRTHQGHADVLFRVACDGWKMCELPCILSTFMSVCKRDTLIQQEKQHVPCEASQTGCLLSDDDFPHAHTALNPLYFWTSSHICKEIYTADHLSSEERLYNFPICLLWATHVPDATMRKKSCSLLMCRGNTPPQRRRAWPNR